MLSGTRENTDPMAARVQPKNVRSARQLTHSLVADPARSDETMLDAVAERVLPKLVSSAEPIYWIVDDTRFSKKGKHSGGATHHYCGQTGKHDNCRIAVSLSTDTERGSLPVCFQLYLPWCNRDRHRSHATATDTHRTLTRRHHNITMSPCEQRFASPTKPSVSRSPWRGSAGSLSVRQSVN